MLTARHLISFVLGSGLTLGSLATPAIASPEREAGAAQISIAPATASSATFVASLTPSKDNTLYEEIDGGLSSGAGAYFFAGNTAQSSNTIRRGLIKFDVTGAIPSNATIVSATLHLTMSQTVAGPQPVRLHRATADWGEGASNASGGGGGGAPAAPGDATWLHTFYSTAFWAAAGGDFVITASATTTVDAVGAYTWGGAGLLSDVQGWLSASATNNGWLILGNENTLKTAKRFDSREHPTPSERPRLVVTYTVPYAIFVPAALKQPAATPGAGL